MSLARIFLLFLLLFPLTARAGDCPNPYSGSQLMNDIQVMQFAMRNVDEASFAVAAGRLESGLPCLNTVVTSQVFATSYRLMGVWYFKKGDPKLGRKWFRASLELSPTAEFSADDLESNDPIRLAFEEERNNLTADATPLEGVSLNVPSGSKLTIDGRPLTAPSASLDRFHIVQQVGTADNSVRVTWLISGNELPQQILRTTAAAPVAAEDNKKKDKKTKEEPVVATTTTTGGRPQPTVVTRLRPPEKTPLMIAGGVAILGAGGLYGAAVVMEQKFHPTSPQDIAFSSPEEVDAAASTINALILGAGGLAVAGLSVGSWGVLMDGGAVGVRFVTGF